MSYRAIHGPITADLAVAEPIDQRLFNDEEDAECSSATTRQQNTPASKGSRLVQLGLPLSSADYPITSDSASYLRSLKKSPIKY
jgi:hypothetical protein